MVNVERWMLSVERVRCHINAHTCKQMCMCMRAHGWTVIMLFNDNNNTPGSEW